MTVIQPYQKRVGITLRRQTTMVNAVRKRKGPVPEHNGFQARKTAKALRETVPVRQQAHWARQEAEQKITDAVKRETLLGEKGLWRATARHAAPSRPTCSSGSRR